MAHCSTSVGFRPKPRRQLKEVQDEDDCALITNSSQDLQAILAVAVKAYSRMDLAMNTSLSEFLSQ